MENKRNFNGPANVRAGNFESEDWKDFGLIENVSIEENKVMLTMKRKVAWQLASMIPSVYKIHPPSGKKGAGLGFSTTPEIIPEVFQLEIVPDRDDPANVFLPIVKIPNINKLYDELSAVEDSSDANFTFVFILAEPRWP
ncbi:MAG: hypothetical protein OXG88_09300 [Gammaproteobacteria bacterium]|nr:hypothetical protein [Gammaproteobacteria bacterium]